MIGLTKALEKEVATEGILVNAVAPAVIGTELLEQMEKSTEDMLVAKIPMGRVGKRAPSTTSPEDVRPTKRARDVGDQQELGRARVQRLGVHRHAVRPR